MVKTFIKTIGRMFQENLGRFFANLLICFFALAISAGLNAMLSDYQESYQKNYDQGKASDIVLKDTTGNDVFRKDLDDVKGSDALAYLKEDEDVLSVDTYMSYDYPYEENYYRFTIEDFSTKSVNLFTLKEGRMPKKSADISHIEILVQEASFSRKKYKVGEKLSFPSLALALPSYSSNIELEVVGIVDSCLYNSQQEEPAQISSEDEDNLPDIRAAFFVNRNSLPETYTATILGTEMELPTASFYIATDCAIRYQRGSRSYFSSEYKDFVEDKKEKLLSHFNADEKEVEALTLEENVSYALFKTYQKKVGSIALIIPIFFLILCGLVNLLTISRLIKEERPLIGTYVSLGYGKGAIVSKYLFFSLLSTGIGSLLGYFFGVPFLPKIIYGAYNSVFELHGLNLTFFTLVGIISIVAVLLLTFFVTLFVSLYLLQESPASLMKRKSPKPGKKILMEHLPFWKKIPFRYKSAFRNIFRNKPGFFLNSFSIMGAVLLLMLSFSLMNISDALRDDKLFGNVASSMGLISVVIIFFALSMAVVVIYSLANMNVMEKQRELATLKVLGYTDSECSLYSFREIILVSATAGLIGLPFSALVLYFVYNYLEFGSLADVKWWSYVLSYAILIVTEILVNLLLSPKIARIDMNDSLKTLE